MHPTNVGKSSECKREGCHNQGIMTGAAAQARELTLAVCMGTESPAVSGLKQGHVGRKVGSFVLAIHLAPKDFLCYQHAISLNTAC